MGHVCLSHVQELLVWYGTRSPDSWDSMADVLFSYANLSRSSRRRVVQILMSIGLAGVTRHLIPVMPAKGTKKKLHNFERTQEYADFPVKAPLNPLKLAMWYGCQPRINNLRPMARSWWGFGDTLCVYVREM